MVPLEIALAHLVLCLYILLRRWLNATTGRLFVAYLFLTALWTINLAVMANNLPASIPGTSWAHLASYGLIVLAVVYWTFARAFLQRSWITPWSWALGMAGLAVVVTLDMGWLAIPPAALAGRNYWMDTHTISFGLGTLWWVLFMAMSALAAEIQQFQTPSPAHKNRIYYLVISTVLLIAGYGMVLSSRESLGIVGLIVTLSGNAVLAYTVIVEDLMDLGTCIRHVTGALVVALVTVAVYAAGIYLVQILLGDFLGSSFLGRVIDHALLIAVVAAILLTIVYTPIRQISQRLANRTLLGKGYDYQSAIHDYSHAISNILYLNELANISVAYIGRTLGVDRGALLILDTETSEQFGLRILPVMGEGQLPAGIALSKETPITQRLVTQHRALAQYTLDISRDFTSVPRDEYQILKELNFEWFIPILGKKQLVGIFALGPKRSGQPYSIQDLSLLDTLADQTALALENAALFDRLQRNLTQTTHMKNLMDNVFASVDNGVITTDVLGQITLFNRAAEAILGVPSERCIGQHYSKVLPSLANTILPSLISNVVNRDGHYSNYEIVSELPARGQVNLSVHLTPLKDARDETKGVAIILEDLTETKRLQAVQDMFRRYVSPAVVDRLPSNPDDLKLGGHRQVVTVLFADIRDFTTFSETVAPEALMDTLNQYLSTAAASILMYEGTLDKFMGDAVMGIFNAPLEQEDHVLQAVRAAAAMQRAIADLHHNIGVKQGLSFGVGIHVGEVVVGNVGMADRMDYTVVGDVVNVAQRIQENAPGGKVLLSEAAYQAVEDWVDAVFYAETHVKGRRRPVRTYDLRRINEGTSP
jgi:PAS domain S-box-containing protein